MDSMQQSLLAWDDSVWYVLPVLDVLHHRMLKDFVSFHSIL